MSFELFYTSAPQGLRPGSSGFCTVAATANIPPALSARLESLSSYRPLFAPGSADAGRNPVLCSHYRVPLRPDGGGPRSVLSRIGPAGFDYTGRPNLLAYHLVVDGPPLPPPGPAWLLMHERVVQRRWDGKPGLMPPAALPLADAVEAGPRPCTAWAEVAGDAGWAGLLAQSFLPPADGGFAGGGFAGGGFAAGGLGAEASPPAYLIYQPGQMILPLLDEALALLPPRSRWRVTFSTYFTAIPAGLTCDWRCVAADTPAAEAARAATCRTRGLLIDLTRGPQGAPDGDAAAAAREGRTVPPPDRGARPGGSPPGSFKE